jgi:hypothetical protein
MAVEVRPAREEGVAEIARLVAVIAAYHESLDERARFDWEEIRRPGSRRCSPATITRSGSPTRAAANWSATYGCGSCGTTRATCRGCAAISTMPNRRRTGAARD